MPVPERPARPRTWSFRDVRDGIEERLDAWWQLAGTARHARAVVRWLSGREKHGGASLSVLYFGSTQSFGYLVDKLYAEYGVDREETGRWIWTASRRLLRRPPPVDLVIGDLPWPYYRLARGSGCLRVPSWIEQRLALADSWAEVEAHFRKNTRTTDLRKVRKHALTYRLTRSRAELDRFYADLYAPYARRRFGALANLAAQEEVVYQGQEGWLLQVMHNETVVGGVVLAKLRSTLYFLWVGLPDALEPGLLDAASSAIYYYAIQHAYAEGCDEISLTLTRPLLSNGIYRYKRKWGARVHDGWRLGEIWLRPLHLGPAVESCLAHQPWIVRESGRLVGRILLDAETASSPEAIRARVSQYASEGLDVLQLCALGPIARAGTTALPGVEYRELGRSADPAAAFCAD